MSKKKEIIVYYTEDDECLCHACALVVFKHGKKIPQGQKVRGPKKCHICGYKIDK